MLYPISNKYRSILNLNGIWKFKCVDDNYLPILIAREDKNMKYLFLFKDAVKIKKDINGKEEITDSIKMVVPNVVLTDKEKKKRIQIDDEILYKKIGIIGLGSIGSRVLMDLARAGFSNFLLCDDDIYLPNNTIRHVILLNLI